MAGDEKKVSQKQWVGRGEKSTYVFNDFENIAYLSTRHSPIYGLY